MFMSTRDALKSWLRVHTPALWLNTREERRAVALLSALGRELNPAREVLVWSASRGLNPAGPAHERDVDPTTLRLSSALEAVWDDMADGRICVFLDADLGEPAAARALKDALNRAGSGTRTVVFVGPSLHQHPSLDRCVVALDLPPPSDAEAREVVGRIEAGYGRMSGRALGLDEEGRGRVARAVAGMGLDEAERVGLKVLLEAGGWDEAAALALHAEKCRQVASDPLLRVERPTERLDDLGGMATFKEWARRQQATLHPDAPASPSQRRLRGVLMVGLPGCGQAVGVRAAASAWRLPLIQLDGLAVSPAGDATTESTQRALAKVEACFPCVLWIPRLDQAFRRGDEEGGVAASPAALALERWLLDRDRRTLVFATTRDPERLPLSMVIRGAFDKTFFLDFPTSDERRQTLRLVFERRGLDPKQLNLEMLVAASDGFSSAQIVQAVDRGLLEAAELGEPLKMLDLLHSLRQTTPMAGYLGESRRRIKAWAHRWALSVSAPKEA